MKKGAPIELVIYDENDEPKVTHRRLIVPWGLLKRAIRLSKDIHSDTDDMTEEDVDALNAFVVEFFGGKFTIEELENGADLEEVLAVFNQIVAKARGTLNPTFPPER